MRGVIYKECIILLHFLPVPSLSNHSKEHVPWNLVMNAQCIKEGSDKPLVLECSQYLDSVSTKPLTSQGRKSAPVLTVTQIFTALSASWRGAGQTRAMLSHYWKLPSRYGTVCISTFPSLWSQSGVSKMKSFYHFLHLLNKISNLSHNLPLTHTILNIEWISGVTRGSEEMKVNSFLFRKWAGTRNLQGRLPFQGLWTWSVDLGKPGGVFKGTILYGGRRLR